MIAAAIHVAAAAGLGGMAGLLGGLFGHVEGILTAKKSRQFHC